jgi:hypothetical protein
MRRRLQIYLPAFLIALMVQIFAPIAASWTAAVAASDPLRFAEVCHSASTFNQKGDQGGQQHDRCDACSICCLATANGSIDTPRIDTFSVPYRAHAPIGWNDQASLVGSARYNTSARARAPPLLS